MLTFIGRHFWPFWVLQLASLATAVILDGTLGVLAWAWAIVATLVLILATASSNNWSRGTGPPYWWVAAETEPQKLALVGPYLTEAKARQGAKKLKLSSPTLLGLQTRDTREAAQEARKTLARMQGSLEGHQ